jgi:BirA family transcriptional regulator, biotin operon repressor / biotin---[acetyl-CoA-carboxylase] ligase
MPFDASDNQGVAGNTIADRSEAGTGRLVILEEAESTQDIAREMAKLGESEGTAVMAVRQTRGRGRTGHSWISPPGKNLALSLILRPPMPPEDAVFLSLLASIAVAETVEEAGVVGAELKWPNDVLVEGKKIAGILSEAAMQGRTVEFVVIGVGLNVNSLTTDFPPELRSSVTSMLLCCGKEVPPEEVARTFMTRMVALYQRLQDEGGGFVPPLWQSRWAHKGCALVHEGTRAVAEGLDHRGALLLRTEDGSVKRVLSGEVLPADEVTSSGAPHANDIAEPGV